MFASFSIRNIISGLSTTFREIKHAWLVNALFINVYIVERCAESHLDLFRDGA